jgi:hypothetical protein
MRNTDAGRSFSTGQKESDHYGSLFGRSERTARTIRARVGSQVALGEAFGWNMTRLHEVLHQLEAAGDVRLSIMSRGTVVRLVAWSA